MQRVAVQKGVGWWAGLIFLCLNAKPAWPAKSTGRLVLRVCPSVLLHISRHASYPSCFSIEVVLGVVAASSSRRSTRIPIIHHLSISRPPHLSMPPIHLCLQQQSFDELPCLAPDILLHILLYLIPPAV